MKKPEIDSQLDLHGNLVEEALPKVDDFLYSAYKSGHDRVWIIHGKGTGVLKLEVSRFLARHCLVRSFYTADKYHGGDGATQVNLIK
ncbi:MAG: Smr/MutS family protein [Dehalococcoidales bacterium]|jgi:DNA mismatch repair protein MutS2|nr:Smr/MutS family protein [Dehalococcoidales bacterium]MDD4229797.1 Smr/MutS family protein [Dehalococcoidales bacterium]MDD4465207.1 Smr/MutS family protein [Dehalococcoidales bacterium]MDD5402108.1 Smr/MutS family protein [Dehalococcoidales bacterium]